MSSDIRGIRVAGEPRGQGLGRRGVGVEREVSGGFCVVVADSAVGVLADVDGAFGGGEFGYFGLL